MRVGTQQEFERSGRGGRTHPATVMACSSQSAGAVRRQSRVDGSSSHTEPTALITDSAARPAANGKNCTGESEQQ